MDKAKYRAYICCGVNCGPKGASSLVDFMETEVENQGLDQDVSVSATGCQAHCDSGPTMVVYPEVKEKAPVVIMIHEIFGFSDWVKEMADELAAQGFIVVAPDLLSGRGPGGGGSDAFPDQDARVKSVSTLNPDAVLAEAHVAALVGDRAGERVAELRVHVLVHRVHHLENTERHPLEDDVLARIDGRVARRRIGQVRLKPDTTVGQFGNVRR